MKRPLAIATLCAALSGCSVTLDTATPPGPLPRITYTTNVAVEGCWELSDKGPLRSSMRKGYRLEFLSRHAVREWDPFFKREKLIEYDASHFYAVIPQESGGEVRKNASNIQFNDKLAIEPFKQGFAYLYVPGEALQIGEYYFTPCTAKPE
jgi:hypothetical protein